MTTTDAAALDLGPLARRARRSLNGDHPGETGTMLPPLVDHHVHLQLVHPDAAVGRGIAAVVDLGGNPGAVAHLARTEGLPRIRYSGAFLTAPGGYPSDRPWAPAGSVRELRLVGESGASEHAHDALPQPIEVAVDEQRSFGASVVKVMLNADAGPVFDRATLDAIVQVARGHGLLVAAHAEGAGMADLAIDAGVDALVHAPFTERLDDALVRRAASVGQAWVSTLAIHVRDDADSAATAIDNVRRFHAAGGHVLYGTDHGNGELADGVNAAELTALGRAGLAASDLIAALADPWPARDGTWTDAGVSTFVPGAAPTDPSPEAVAAWLATARIVPTEELEHV